MLMNQGIDHHLSIYNIFVLSVCLMATINAFPLQKRLIFHCNGWAAGCMNSYSTDGTPAADLNTVYRKAGTSEPWTQSKQDANYFFTSGSVWRPIGKRFGWPVTREIMSPVSRFSADFYEKLLRKLMIKGKK